MAIFKCLSFSQVLIDHAGVLEDVHAPHLVHEKVDSNVLNLKLLYDSENSRIYEKLCHLILLTHFLSILLYWIRDLFPSKYCCHILHVYRACVQTPECNVPNSDFCPFSLLGKVHKKTRWCFQVTYTRDLKGSQKLSPSIFPSKNNFQLIQSLRFESFYKAWLRVPGANNGRNERGENIFKSLMCFFL